MVLLLALTTSVVGQSQGHFWIQLYLYGVFFKVAGLFLASWVESVKGVII